MGPFGVHLSSLWASLACITYTMRPFDVHNLHNGPYSFTPPIRLFESAAIILHIAEQQVGPFGVHPEDHYGPLWPA